MLTRFETIRAPRVLLVAVVLLALLSILLSVFGFQPKDSVSPPARGATEVVNGPAAAVLQDPVSSSNLRTALLSAPAEGRQLPADGTASAALPQVNEYGTVTGTVSDHEGKMLPNQRVLLVLGEDLIADAIRIAFTDEYGYYTIDRVPAGHCTVVYGGDRASSRQSGSKQGTLEVIGNRVNEFHVVLEGDRSINGSFVISDVPGVGVALELRRASDGSVVGHGWAIVAIEEARKPRHREGVDEQEDDRAAEPSGSFRFAGLGPDFYILRVTLGVDGTGRSIYIEKELDLTAGNLDLGRSSYTLLEFLQQRAS